MNTEWHKFDINDKSTYPPKKGNYIVSYHFPEDFNVDDYTSECNWAEYTNGEFDWSPQFGSKFVTAWTYLPEVYTDQQADSISNAVDKKVAIDVMDEVINTLCPYINGLDTEEIAEIYMKAISKFK